MLKKGRFAFTAVLRKKRLERPKSEPRPSFLKKFREYAKDTIIINFTVRETSRRDSQVAYCQKIPNSSQLRRKLSSVPQEQKINNEVNLRTRKRVSLQKKHFLKKLWKVALCKRNRIFMLANRYSC